MNVLAADKKLTIVSALVEGASIRSIERMTGVHRDTIMRLGLNVGNACARFLDARIKNVSARKVQVDEIWTYVFKKQARISIDESAAGIGDQYVFVGIDADTKLVISHLVGKKGWRKRLSPNARSERQACYSRPTHYRRIQALYHGRRRYFRHGS